jgi:hypothetical protein
LSRDIRNSLTALLAVLLFFCGSYALIAFMDENVSWTASTVTLALILAILALRTRRSPEA